MATTSRRALYHSVVTSIAQGNTSIDARGHDVAAAKLLLFSANGVDENVLDAGARRDDVELVDLDRMYSGE